MTTQERSRLVRFAQKLGAALQGLVTIITPGTIQGREAGKEPDLGKTGSQANSPGNLLTDCEICTGEHLGLHPGFR